MKASESGMNAGPAKDVARRHRLLLAPVCAAMCVVVAAMAVGRSRNDGEADIASVSLTCAPAEHGVHCRLLALFRDVARSPRDVTKGAVWHISGIAGVNVSVDGTVESQDSGDAMI